MRARPRGLPTALVAIVALLAITSMVSLPALSASGSASTTGSPSSVSVSNPALPPAPSQPAPPLGGPAPGGPSVCQNPANVSFRGQVVISTTGSISPAGAPVKVSGGRVVFTGPVNGSVLDLASNLVVDGSGCRLVYSPAPVTHYGNSTAVEVRGGSNATVENFLVVANGSRVGVWVNHTTSVTVYNVSAPGETTGVASNSSTDVNVSRVSVGSASTVGVEFLRTVEGIAEYDSASGSAIGLESNASESITFELDTATGAHIGAQFAYDSGTVVTSSDLAGATVAGAFFLGSANDTLSDSDLSGNAPSGVLIGGSAGALTVEDNVITGGLTDGVRVNSGTGPLSITGNVLANATSIGIDVEALTGTLTIASNDLASNATAHALDAIELGLITGSVLIQSNDLSGGASYAVYVSNTITDALTLTGNQIRNSSIAAFYVYGELDGPLSVVGNDLSGNASTSAHNAAGIVINHVVFSSVSIANNTITGGLQYGIAVEGFVGGTVNLTGNDLANATADSLLIADGVGGNLDLLNNDFAANSTTMLGDPDGVQVQGYPVTGSTWIGGNDFSGGLDIPISLDPAASFEYYDFAAPSGSVTIVGNDLANVTYEGVYILYVGGDLTIADNDFAANASTEGETTGVYVDYALWEYVGFYPIQGSVYVYGNDFSGGLEDCLDFEGPVGGSVWISSNNFANETNDGYAVDLAGVQGNLVIVGNDLSANASSMYQSWAISAADVGGSVWIADNNMTGGEYGGVGLEDVDGATTIVDNDIANVTSIAIELDQMDAVTIEGNDLSTNASTSLGYEPDGIQVYDYATTVTVLDNNLSGGLWQGIDVEDATSFLAVNNSLPDTLSNGIYAGDDWIVTIADNNVSQSQGTGILVDASGNVSITDNTLQDAPYAIQANATWGPALIEGNNASGSGSAIDFWMNASDPFYLTLEANNFSGSSSVTVNNTRLNAIGNDALGTPTVNLTMDTVQAFYHNDFDTGPGSTLVVTGTVPVLGSFNAPLPTAGNFWSGCPFTSVTNGIGSPPCAVGAYFDDYPLASPWYSYAVTFTEVGLPVGTTWSVGIAGVGVLQTVAPGTLEFFPQNGASTSYNFTIVPRAGLSASLQNSSFTAVGHALHIGVRFGYSVTFSETGLAGGTAWAVTFNGSLMSGTAPGALTFTGAANGTYAFALTAPAGYRGGPLSGHVRVDGSSVDLSVTFVAIYSVTFTETGLPTDTSWAVTFNGTSSGATSPSSIVFSGFSNATYAFAVAGVVGYQATPSSGNIQVQGSDLTEMITFAPPPPSEYTVTFTERGLASGSAYRVTLNGTLQSANAPTSILFTGYPNGTYPFIVGSVAGYRANLSSGNLTIHGADRTVAIGFTPLYNVTFSESGIPNGTSWNVRFNGTTMSIAAPTSLTFTGFANGSYPFVVGGVTGYRSTPSSGTVNVTGRTADEAIAFTPLPPGEYSVTFTETGLANETPYAVSLNGTLGGGTAPGSVAFTQVLNGSYPFTVASVAGYRVSPASGRIQVNGSAVTQSLMFTPLPPGEYSVSFAETGLPVGQPWSVMLNGTSESASAPSRIVFTGVENGSYGFEVSGVAGFRATPDRGNVSVNGADVNQSVAFTPLPHGLYSVTFTETGLPSGAAWSATMNGSTESVVAPGTLTFSGLANGSYPYTVRPSNPFVVLSGGNGTAVVSGADLSVSVGFEFTTIVTFHQTGISNGTVWTLQVTLTATLARHAAPLSVGESWFLNATGPFATLRLANGTYSYTVSAPGYTTASGPFSVSGSPTTVSVPVSAAPGPAGLPSWVWIAVAAGVAAAVVLIAVLLLVVKPRRGSGASSPPTKGAAAPTTPPAPGPSPPPGQGPPPPTR